MSANNRVNFVFVELSPLIAFRNEYWTDEDRSGHPQVMQRLL